MAGTERIREERRQPNARERERLERLRKEKERKRRLELQKRKRRRRRIQLFFRLIKTAAVVTVVVLVCSGAGRLLGGRFSEGVVNMLWHNGAEGSGGQETLPASAVPVLASGTADEAVLAKLSQMYAGNPQAQDILEHPENYPDDLLALLAKRPETLTFVLHYPENKNVRHKVDLSGEIEQGKIPLFYQWDERWGYDAYGDNIVALAGCGPTCLSMVAVGLTGDTSLHPGEVARFSAEKGFVTEAGTAWDLMTLGAEELGLHSEELPLDEGRMRSAVENGMPVICSMRPGDFTDTGHFIVLVGWEDGGFRVNDPNSKDNSSRLWTYEELEWQIKNLWAYSL